MGQMDRIYRVCLVPLSRFLNRIAAVTRPKTAPYLGRLRIEKINTSLVESKYKKVVTGKLR